METFINYHAKTQASIRLVLTDQWITWIILSIKGSCWPWVSTFSLISTITWTILSLWLWLASRRSMLVALFGFFIYGLILFMFFCWLLYPFKWTTHLRVQSYSSWSLSSNNTEKFHKFFKLFRGASLPSTLKFWPFIKQEVGPTWFRRFFNFQESLIQ